MKQIRNTFLLIVAFFVFTGCSAGLKSSYPVRQYALEYSSPVFNGKKPLNKTIKLERLSIDRKFSGTAMVYRSQPSMYGDDAQFRWYVRPSNMISDLLLRDFRNSGLFKGVFSYQEQVDSDYNLYGTVEEFYELEGKAKNSAVIGIRITLIENKPKEIASRTVYQKSYRAIRPMQHKNAESLSLSASEAMQNLVRDIILDSYETIKNRKN